MKAHRRNLTILLADCDPNEYYLLRDALEVNGYEGKLDYVSDEKELMSYLRKGRFHPSIILLEPNGLGGKNGEVLSELRFDPELRHLPVVVMSAAWGPEDVALSYALGARSHIAKPLTFDEQVRVVKNLLAYWADSVVLPEGEPCSNRVEPFRPGPPEPLEPGIAV